LRLISRHGETEWSLSGQHTGRTDIPLTEEGERKLWDSTSALRDSSLIGFSPVPSACGSHLRTCWVRRRRKLDPDLLEWNYGDYEGRKSSEILADRPGWLCFATGARTASSQRCRRPCRSRHWRLRAADDQAIVFPAPYFKSAGGALVGLAPSEGRLFMLGTASVSILGYEHDKDEPAVALWNSM